MKVNAGNYSDLWKAIIRPPRDQYSIDDLGPRSFMIGKKKFDRQDVDLKNPSGDRLKCSHFVPSNYDRLSTRLPCVIYLHGNCSSRVEALPSANILLPLNITVFAFDFSGCGHSEGEWVTLGFKEKEDLQCIIDYLRSNDQVSLIGLWGRSMGAVTSILHAQRDPSIAGMVLDSPFSNLNKLSLELAKTHTKIPQFVAKLVQKFVRSSIKSRTKLDIEKHNPSDYVTKCFTPSLFVVANGDDFVRPHHGEEMFKLYAGEDKNLIRVEGDHNSDRPHFMMDSVAIFFHNVLQCDKIQGLEIEEQIDDQHCLVRLDEIFERQKLDQEREQARLTAVSKMMQENEDDEYKQAVLESIDTHQEAQQKEKVLDQFFYELEHCWREKENFGEILDNELNQMDRYFSGNEKESIKSLALQRRNSVSDLRPKREAFGQVDLNKIKDDAEKQQLYVEPAAEHRFSLQVLKGNSPLVISSQSPSQFKGNSAHLKNFYPGSSLQDKILSKTQQLNKVDEARKELSIRSSQDLVKGYTPALQRYNSNSKLPAIRGQSEVNNPEEGKLQLGASHASGMYQTVDNRNTQIESLEQPQRYSYSNTNSRPVSNESQINRILGMRNDSQSQEQQQRSNGVHRSSSMQQLQTVEEEHPLKDMKAFLGDNMSSQKRFLHPVTKEEIIIDKNDLLRNTAKCPFQHSVRDQTNYYFKNGKKIEEIIDSQNASNKAMNRRLRLKNSYMTIFPMYGLQKNEQMFRATQFSTIGTQLEKAEKLDTEYFVKVDYMKKYYEEMLKAKNMRMNKK